MESLPPRFHNKPLVDLAIPGSHDSGSYSLSPQSPYSNRLDPKVAILNEPFCILQVDYR